MGTKQELIIPELGTLTADAVYGSAKSVGDILTLCREATDGVVFDMTTKKGQNECRSFAFKITRSRTLLDDLGKEHTKELRAKLKATDNLRKHLRDSLDALRDEVRQPLTELEEAEKALQAKIEQRIEELKVPLWPYESQAIQTKLTALKATELDTADFGARFKEAQALLRLNITNGEEALKHATEREAEEQRKIEEAAEAQRIREEEIAEKARQEERERIEEAEKVSGHACPETNETIEEANSQAQLTEEVMAERARAESRLRDEVEVNPERPLDSALSPLDIPTRHPDEVTLTDMGFKPNSADPPKAKLYDIRPVDEHPRLGAINHAMQHTVIELTKRYGKEYEGMFKEIICDVTDCEYFYLRLDV